MAEETADDATLNGESDLGLTRNADDEEPVKLSDILEITFELLDLVEGHVQRTGTLDEIARFENQLKVLRRGRDQAKSSGHIEDKRAIILAFSIFTEHYTLMVREFEKLNKKNAALKQLAYDTAGLVKKSESQFESYVNELKQLQGEKANVTQSTKIELTKLRNEVTGLKLELNLRTNELRELQLESNSQQEQLRRERERAEEMRKDKDHRITSLLAQLQQFSLDYAHEKSERLRLERENDRLWSDRMAYRAEQIRGQHLSAAERTLATERDATEKREWLEWKKKAALRDIAAKERMRTDAWEVRRQVEQEAQAQMDKIRRELGEVTFARKGNHRDSDQADQPSTKTSGGKSRSHQDREYWMANETVPTGFPTNLSPISSQATSTTNAQRWNARMERQREEEEIDRQIEELRLRNEQTQLRSSTYPIPPSASVTKPYTPTVPVTGVIRAGGYEAGVESVLTNERASPALPYFSTTPASALTWQNPPSLQPNDRTTRNYTSTNMNPGAISYQPITQAAIITPHNTAFPQQQQQSSQQQQQPQQSQYQYLQRSTGLFSTSDSKAVEEQLREMKRQLDELQAENRKTTGASASTNVRPSSASAHFRSSSTDVGAPRLSTVSQVADFEAIEEGLKRSRAIRSESTRVVRSSNANSSSAMPLNGEILPTSSTGPFTQTISTRVTTTSTSSTAPPAATTAASHRHNERAEKRVEIEDVDDDDEDEEDGRDDGADDGDSRSHRKSSHTRPRSSRRSHRSPSQSRSPSRSPIRERERNRDCDRSDKSKSH